MDFPENVGKSVAFANLATFNQNINKNEWFVCYDVLVFDLQEKNPLSLVGHSPTLRKHREVCKYKAFN